MKREKKKKKKKKVKDGYANENRKKILVNVVEENKINARKM